MKKQIFSLDLNFCSRSVAEKIIMTLSCEYGNGLYTELLNTF